MRRLTLPLLLLLAACGRGETYDVVIRHGTVYDGSGEAPLSADVAIRGDKIAAIAQADRAVALNPGDNRIRYNAACANAQAGRTEEAIAHLKAAVANLPDYVVVWPLRDPDLASLRDHPEFVRMFGKA